MTSHVSWDRLDELSSTQRLEVLDFINRIEVETRREALDETRRRGVVHGWKGEHWLHYSDGRLVGYAIVHGSHHATIEMCGGGFDDELNALVLQHHPIVDWWVRNQTLDVGNVVRTLQILTVVLPAPQYPLPPGSILRTFEPGADEERWLAQNNAAFANHPEQGAWHIDDLMGRIAEPWFDPSGFLLLEIDGTLAATCWTKVHELYAERFGEIYVLSVAPAHQGKGLGRIMLAQGLESLRRKGVRRAVIFVDADNQSALTLYHEFGATLERQDQLVRFSSN